MRESEGCMKVRLPEFRKPAGVPSQVPIRKMGEAGVTQAEAMLWPLVVEPAFTVTVRVATPSSPWYSVWVYVPGFIAGLVKLPLAGVQYCAVLFAQPTMAVAPAVTPEAVPVTKPRPDAATEPVKPKLYMKVMSGAAGADVPATIRAYGPYSTPSRCDSVSL